MGIAKVQIAKKNQVRILANSEFNISISSRSYLNLRNNTGFLESDNFFNK